jgi:hypothetical protein
MTTNLTEWWCRFLTSGIRGSTLIVELDVSRGGTLSRLLECAKAVFERDAPHVHRILL